MSGKYGMNSIVKSKAEMEESFGNNVHGVGPELPCPPALRKWMDDVRKHNADEFRKSNGLIEDWRPRGTGDPKAPPPHWNKKDKV